MKAGCWWIRHQGERRVHLILEHGAVDERQFVAGTSSDNPAGGVDDVGNLLGTARRRALIEQRRDEARHTRPIRRLLHRTGAHQQAETDRGLLVVQHNQHLQSVRQRLQLVGRKGDLAHGERARRRFARPILALGTREGRHQHGTIRGGGSSITSARVRSR